MHASLGRSPCMLQRWGCSRSHMHDLWDSRHQTVACTVIYGHCFPHTTPLPSTRRPWQEPVDAAAVATSNCAPGLRHDALNDLRIVTWNLCGLRYQGPGTVRVCGWGSSSNWQHSRVIGIVGCSVSGIGVQVSCVLRSLSPSAVNTNC